MNNRYIVVWISALIIFDILAGCSNEQKVDIGPPKEITSIEKEKTITPLPATQRLRLLPVDMSTQVNENTGHLEASVREMTTNVPNQSLTTPPASKQNDMNTSNISAGGFGTLELNWVTPEGWKEDTSRPMRIVSFYGKDNAQWECYISVLVSQGGGIEANFKRWATQMGKSDFDTQTISQLPDITVLGKTCKLLDITGNYVDMQGNAHENYRLLGVVCPLEEKTVFIKMTGPEKEISLQKDNFFKLCNSLTLKN